jgi:hypothetical protein
MQLFMGLGFVLQQQLALIGTGSSGMGFLALRLDM